MLTLSKKGILEKIRRTCESGPARTTMLSTVASAVGLAAGKTGDNRVHLYAAGGGVAAHLVGFHTVGDGALAAAAVIEGYKRGVRKQAGG